MVICQMCGVQVELGRTVTKDCDGCLKAYFTERRRDVRRGVEPWRTSAWAQQRAKLLGFLPID